MTTKMSEAEELRDEAIERAAKELSTAYDHVAAGRLAEAEKDTSNALGLIRDAIRHHSKTPVRSER